MYASQDEDLVTILSILKSELPLLFSEHCVKIDSVLYLFPFRETLHEDVVADAILLSQSFGLLCCVRSEITTCRELSAAIFQK